MARTPIIAELALCPCGARGCDFAEQHAQAFIEPVAYRRRWRKKHRRHR